MVKKLIAILALMVLVASASIPVEGTLNKTKLEREDHTSQTRKVIEIDGDFQKFVEESKKSGISGINNTKYLFIMKNNNILA